VPIEVHQVIGASPIQTSVSHAISGAKLPITRRKKEHVRKCAYIMKIGQAKTLSQSLAKFSFQHRVPKLLLQFRSQYPPFPHSGAVSVLSTIEPRGGDVCGKALVEKLRPGEEHCFVLKPKHSGFFSSTLEILLSHLEAKTLIPPGIAGDRCVPFTANDAFLRDYRLFVPADCVVSNHRTQNRDALLLMKRVLKADIRRSDRIPLNQLKKAPPPGD